MFLTLGPCRAPRKNSAGAFTLVELLVVVGTIVLLIAMLLPTLASAREQAKLVQCAANLHQIGIALYGYAAASNGRFPPNLSSPSPGQIWCDMDRIGRHLSYTLPTPMTRPGGPAFTCPNDEGARMSYAMNVWASCAVDPAVRAAIPTSGRLWSQHSREAWRMILVTEAWSGTGSPIAGFHANATIGFRGATAGQRFGGGAGIAPPFSAGRWGQVNCELAYLRHRKRGMPGVKTQPRGRINILYGDGRVETRSDEDLVVQSTGESTQHTRWCPGF